MDYFRNVVALPSLAATGAKLSFKGFVTGELWIALVTFLYIDFLDTTGTLFSMASFINNYIPGAPCLASALCLLSRTTCLWCKHHTSTDQKRCGSRCWRWQALWARTRSSRGRRLRSRWTALPASSAA